MKNHGWRGYTPPSGPGRTDKPDRFDATIRRSHRPETLDVLESYLAVILRA
jgi:hypothetical protein